MSIFRRQQGLFPLFLLAAAKSALRNLTVKCRVLLTSLCSAMRNLTAPWNHRHRIDKYLDTLLANQPISDGEATYHCQKVAPQDGELPELIVARYCITNHSEAASL